MVLLVILLVKDVTEVPPSRSWVPPVFPQMAISPEVEDAGPTTVPAAGNAAGGCGLPLRFPQRVFDGNTPVHWPKTGVRGSNRGILESHRSAKKARRNFFMARCYS